MKKIINNLLAKTFGKKRYQRLYEYLYYVSLSGMNMGAGGAINSSGEKQVIHFIRDNFRDLDTVTIFDVGANVGHYSILLHDLFRENGRIFAFEPSKKNFEKLLATTKGMTNVSQFNFGFSNEDGRITLYGDQDESSWASLYQRRLDHINVKMNAIEEIELRTIDGFCKENNVTRINFLKIDVEGHELKVLQGAKDMIKAKGIDFIQFEFGGCNIDSRTYFQDFYYLLKDDFKIFRVLKDGLHPIPVYKEFYEVFQNTNFLAERIGR